MSTENAEEPTVEMVSFSLWIAEGQGADIFADNPVDNEELTRTKAPSSEALISDVQDRLIDHAIVERWHATGSFSTLF